MVNNREEDYKKIASYYSKAKAAIDGKNEALASRIIFNDMPRYLYDISLDILYNYNSTFESEETRELVRYVDKKLSTVSSEPEDDDYDESVEDEDINFLT